MGRAPLAKLRILLVRDRRRSLSQLGLSWSTLRVSDAMVRTSFRLRRKSRLVSRLLDLLHVHLCEEWPDTDISKGGNHSLDININASRTKTPLRGNRRAWIVIILIDTEECRVRAVG